MEGQLRCAGRLQRLDAILDLGVLSVGRFEHREVVALLVGDEALEAVPVVVCEGELGAGMGALAPADQPCPLGPAVEVDPARQLGHPRSLAGLAVGVRGGPPGSLGQRQDRLADVARDRVAEREADRGLAASEREVVACAGRIGADEDVAVERRLGELLERQFERGQCDRLRCSRRRSRAAGAPPGPRGRRT